MRPPARAAPIITKPNSPPGPSKSAISMATRARQAESAPQRHKHETLERDQAHGKAEDERGSLDDEGGIDLGADRYEIEPEQHTHERLH